MHKDLPIWMSWPSVRRLFDVFSKENTPLFAVGGSVRDAILGLGPKDVDFATAAAPDQTIAILQTAGIRAVPTGIDHGTVTAVIDGMSHEITTFRADIETDGRHATVVFTKDRQIDALRRDFTMNALYMGSDGQIYDDAGGIEDAQAGRLRFIGDPSARLAEDYLRMLRFFRFSARFSKTAPDAAALEAIAQAAQGLARVSAERIGSEIVQLFETAAPLSAVQLMQEAGVAAVIFDQTDIARLTRAIALERVLDRPPHAMMRLAVYSQDHLKDRLRLSNAQAKEIEAIQNLRTAPVAPVELGHDWPAPLSGDGLIAMRAFEDRDVSDQDLLDLKFGQDSSCPITAKDFAGFYQGPALGAALKKAKRLWLQSKGTMSIDTIRERLHHD